MIDNRLNFTGRVHFVNHESYKNFAGYRQSLNDLKHHCGNNNFTHSIQHDKNFFVITTSFEPKKKIDDVTAYVLSHVTGPQDSEKINTIVKSHINKVQLWKKKLAPVSQNEPVERNLPRKESIFDKFLKFFKKR